VAINATILKYSLILDYT